MPGSRIEAPEGRFPRAVCRRAIRRADGRPAGRGIGEEPVAPFGEVDFLGRVGGDVVRGQAREASPDQRPSPGRQNRDDHPHPEGGQEGDGEGGAHGENDADRPPPARPRLGPGQGLAPGPLVQFGVGDLPPAGAPPVPPHGRDLGGPVPAHEILEKIVPLERFAPDRSGRPPLQVPEEAVPEGTGVAPALRQPVRLRGGGPLGGAKALPHGAEVDPRLPVVGSPVRRGTGPCRGLGAHWSPSSSSSEKIRSSRPRRLWKTFSVSRIRLSRMEMVYRAWRGGLSRIFHRSPGSVNRQ